MEDEKSNKHQLYLQKAHIYLYQIYPMPQKSRLNEVELLLVLQLLISILREMLKNLANSVRSIEDILSNKTSNLSS